MNSHSFLTPALAVAAALTMSACSSPAGSPASAELDCLTPDPSVATRISDGATSAALTPIATAAVEAPALGDAYLVAMTFSTEGLDGQDTGVWAVTDIDGGSTSVLAIDGVAQSFTDWPGEFEGEPLSISEPGAQQAIDCLSG